MESVDFTYEQKQKMLLGVNAFLKAFCDSYHDENTYKNIAISFWDEDAYQIPNNYKHTTEYGDNSVVLNNDFEGKYKLLKALLIILSGNRKPLGYGVLLTYYANLFHSITLRLDSLQDDQVVAIKYVLTKYFENNENIKDIIEQDLDGIGKCLTKVRMFYIHPLWTTSAFYEEIVFHGEM